MKIKFTSEGKASLMRQSKWMALFAVGALTMSGSALAQDYVTGTPYLSNLNMANLNTPPNALYPGWNNPSPVTTLTDGPSGLEVQSYAGYGSMFYSTTNAPVFFNANDNTAILTLTVNNVANAQANEIGR